MKVRVLQFVILLAAIGLGVTILFFPFPSSLIIQQHKMTEVAATLESTTFFTPDPTQTLPSFSNPDLTAVPTPIKFSFPTQAPPPHSAWRPPLYPVPWAPTENDHFFLTRPIHADEVNWPSGNYRYGGVFFENTVHTGIDIAAPEGTPVIAAGPGKIVWAGKGLYNGIETDKDPYGMSIVIRHPFGYQNKTLFTVYGHLSRLDVVKGQYVESGELLGNIGQTGFTTGPHLHFEVRLGDNDFFKTYNPELWLAPPQGWGIIAAQIMTTAGIFLSDHLIEVHNLDTNQTWWVQSYGGGPSGVNNDPFYQENLVIGDLPAGKYQIMVPYLGTAYRTTMHLEPGLVNYFSFRGREGFDFPDFSESDEEFPPIPTLDK